MVTSQSKENKMNKVECGPTHYEGCSCHEKERNDKIESLEAKRAILETQLEKLTLQLQTQWARTQVLEREIERLQQGETN